MTVQARNKITRACARVNIRAGASRHSLVAALGLAMLATSLGAGLHAPAAAQPGEENELIEKLKTCQAQSDDTARLECFDAAVGRFVSASEAGDVRVVDREEIRENRRSLFGFNIPNKGILAEPDDEVSDTLETTVTSVRYITSRKVRFRTQEGATWEIGNAPSRMRRIEVGDPVEFKKAALGSYFVKIKGQRGVKGVRVE